MLPPRRTALSLVLIPLLAGAALGAPNRHASPRPPAHDEAQLRADVAALVAFGTRHTLSADAPTRGIGAARRWAADQFSAICGGCLAVSMPEAAVTGDRLGKGPAKIADVIAVQKGTDRPDEVVIIEAHIDSRVTDVMNATADAPGANDDGSGVAVVLAAARALAPRHFAGTIVYAITSGEEQGLYGAKLLADTAAAQHWQVKAVLNNDIVGNSRGADGLVDDTHVRLFSEGPRADADDRLTRAQRAEGGENDSPSRNLARFIGRIAAADGGLAVQQIWRADRAGRSGDHVPFQKAGDPAVRFTVAVENYDRQHQDLRTDHGRAYGDTADAMDFHYLARVARLNTAVLAALAASPMPPAPAARMAVSDDTALSWLPVAGAARYRVWKRATDAATWEAEPLATVSAAPVAGAGMLAVNPPLSLVLHGLRGDDWFLGVSSVAADGAESPIAAALPGGAFAPLAPPAP